MTKNDSLTSMACIMKASKYNIKVAEINEKTVLYNTRTNMLIRVPNQAYELLTKVSDIENPQKQPYIASFIRRGFCVPQDLDESNHFWGQYLRFADTDSQELSFTIATTTACNYRCSYCFEEGSPIQNMSAETAEELCLFMEENARCVDGCKKISIKWFGGEPLLTYPIIVSVCERIQQYCTQHGIELRTRIITNGALLTEDMIQTLCRFGLISIQISLDGTCEQYCQCKGASPQDYHNVISVIRKFCDKVHFNLRFNCLPDNLQSLTELTDELYADQRIRDHVTLYLAQVESDAVLSFDAEEFAYAMETFLSHLQQIGWYSQIKNALPDRHTSICYALKKNNYMIGPSGDIFACESHVGNPSLRIADFKEDLHSITEKKKKFEQQFRRSLTGQCRQCTYFPLCFSGCPNKPRNEKACRSFQKQISVILREISCIPE